MLERLVRRLLWIVPTALGVSLLTFYLLAFVPSSRLATTSPHARFQSLPVFFNTAPNDVRGAVDDAVSAVLATAPGSERGSEADRMLVSLGGAALPHLLPTLDAHSPEQRMRLLVALAPLARRMGLEGAADAESPRTALRFWTRFWEASEVEFKLATARSVVRRWVVYGDVGREREVFRLDTFALEPLFELLADDPTEDTLARSRRIVDAIAHVTEGTDRIASDATPTEARACIARWRRHWIGHRARFTQLRGSDRISAFVLESRFGKWAEETLSGSEAPQGASGELRARAIRTVALLALGWTLAVALGGLAGFWSALRRPSVSGRLPVWLAVTLLAVTPVGLASLAARIAETVPFATWLLSSLALAGALLAKPLFATRTRVLETLHGDVALGARARGSSSLRIAWQSGLRGAASAVAAEVLLDLPFAATMAFVVERAFELRGLGETTLTSVARGEVGPVMTLAAAGTCWGGVALLLADTTFALTTPHARAALLRLGKRA